MAGISSFPGISGFSGISSMRGVGGTGVAGSSGVSTSAAPYLGQVATKSRMSDTNGSGMTAAMVRTQHTARAAITVLQVAYANWYANTSGEFSVSTSTTFKTVIEYPASTFSNSVTWVATSGATPLSPSIAITIPDGAEFWVRTLITGSNFCYRNGNSSNLPLDTAAGEGMEFAFGGGVSDKTSSGTVGNTNPSALPGIYPVAIVSQITKKSVFIFGDSIAAGLNDTFDAARDIGIVARSIGSSYGYIQACMPSDSLSMFNSDHAKRTALAQYCSHVIGEYGVNDISSGDNLATLQARYAAVWAISDFNGKPNYKTTLTPESTSADNWATIILQVPKSGWGIASVQANINTWLRGVPAGLTGAYDVSTVLDNGADTGKWKVTGSAFGYTADGVHPNYTGYLLVKNSGSITL